MIKAKRVTKVTPVQQVSKVYRVKREIPVLQVKMVLVLKLSL